jgi:hypothetical protein
MYSTLYLWPPDNLVSNTPKLDWLPPDICDTWHVTTATLPCSGTVLINNRQHHCFQEIPKKIWHHFRWDFAFGDMHTKNNIVKYAECVTSPWFWRNKYAFCGTLDITVAQAHVINSVWRRLINYYSTSIIEFRSFTFGDVSPGNVRTRTFGRTRGAGSSHR